ncbi:MAG: UvrD-helicase domain-containing protein [Saprospiraceae bacterium]
MRLFDVLKIELKDKNLIEASAGTGKTYAIGILTLRLLLEKNIKIEQILMVTYTNAAVEELEIRIRKFIYIALNYTRYNIDTDNKQIKDIIEKSIKTNGKDKTLALLNEAIEFFDETSIFTIHGFCKKVITDYAFENSMLLNTELIEDQSNLIEEFIAEFWRENIATLDPEVLKSILDENFSFKNINSIFSKVSNGGKIRIKNIVNFTETASDIKLLKAKIEYNKNILFNTFESSWQYLSTLKVGRLKNITNAIKQQSAEDLYEELKQKLTSEKINNDLYKLEFLFSESYDVINAEQELSTYILDLIANLYKKAVDFISIKLEQKKKRNKLVSFHDLIQVLHNTLVVSNNENLKKELNYKYRAIFIDEFQDTDILQYQIFKKLFIDNSNAILFLIGDPKQSIYGFRGADLETYTTAKDNLKNSVFSMNTNFRSTKELLLAINDFFHVDNSTDDIIQNNLDYTKVEFGNEYLGKLINTKGENNPFEVIENYDLTSQKEQNQSIILTSMINEIVELLSNYEIQFKDKTIKISPSDIGILVRNNSHGALIKEKLAQHNIPSIIIDDTKVLETNEAKELYYVLFAIFEPEKSSINRALLTSFTNFTQDEIKKLNFEILNEKFNTILSFWTTSGVYSAISQFINLFDIQSHLINSETPNGNRIYTNLIHIAEILNEKEIYDGLSQIQLLDWLLRAIQGDKSVAKYEQKLESDDNSIQIVTVHKSKGLAYNIVILPLFNLTPHTNNDFCIEYKDENNEKIISVYKDNEEIESVKHQEIQENERLLYVAITRSVYKCIVHFNNNQNGILNSFIPKLNSNSNNIFFKHPNLNSVTYKYSSNNLNTASKKPLLLKSKINNYWKITSYSSLANHKEYKPKYKLNINSYLSEYDEFIFNTLPKGVQTGLIIHKIFELIDFSSSKYHSNSIKNVLNDYGIIADSTLVEKYQSITENVLNSKLVHENFKLSEIESKDKITELEFFFSIDNFNTYLLQDIFPDLDISYPELEGVMHGFIDLVFEKSGKFYILDWKTNHLGSDINDYSEENLEAEIINNNYNLQYSIYTIALNRYLKSKKPDYDYKKDFGGIFYIFIRGVRTDKQSGVYFIKPNESLIKKLEDLF